MGFMNKCLMLLFVAAFTTHCTFPPLMTLCCLLGFFLLSLILLHQLGSMIKDMIVLVLLIYQIIYVLFLYCFELLIILNFLDLNSFCPRSVDMEVNCNCQLLILINQLFPFWFLYLMSVFSGILYYYVHRSIVFFFLELFCIVYPKICFF